MNPIFPAFLKLLLCLPLALAASGMSKAQEIKATSVPPPGPARGETAFAGQVMELHWVIEANTDVSGQARVSIFRVLASTVAPMEANLVVGDPLKLSNGAPQVISHEFVPPASDRPANYLLRLSFLSGDSEKVISNCFVSAIPTDLLKQHASVSAVLIGFKDGVGEVKDFLEASGWKSRLEDSLPADLEADLVIHGPDSTSKPAPEKGIIYRNLATWGGMDRPTVTILVRNSSGEMVRFEIPMVDWLTLPTSAEQQRLLSGIANLAADRP
jgi:hypothetical protein